MDGQEAPNSPARTDGEDQRMREAAEELVRRRAGGEALSREEVEKRYPELMPRVWELMRLKEKIRDQINLAQRAGPEQERIEPLSDQELGLPIVEEEVNAAALDRPLLIQGYRIVREISSGGQAAVFEARQEITGRKVAVKVILGGPMASSRVRARYEREVKALALLNHPNIVGIVDRGRTSDRSLFLAMDYIEGEALDAHVATLPRGREGQRAVVTLFAKIAMVLEEAHRQGIIHRDIKPSNIRIDRFGEPHILDFGLAHLGDGQVSVMTLAGSMVGSLPWASPEQVNGSIEELGAATDVYALGVTLFGALAGQPPYRVEGPVMEVIGNILQCAPEWPGARAGMPFGAIDQRLRSVVSKAMEKKAADRYASGGALAADLWNYLAGKPLAAQPLQASGGRVAAAVLAACIAAAAGVWAWQPWSTVDDQKVVALPSFENGFHMRMIQMPAGGMVMGGSDSMTGDGNWETRRVMVPEPYSISATEVTRGQFKAVLGYLPAGVPDRDLDFPVDHVSRADARKFCEALNQQQQDLKYHLPSEAQWEYACRAGQNNFNQEKDLGAAAWFAKNSRGVLHEVASRRPNRWGLYDMLGGVAEWCDDEWVNRLGSDPMPRPVARRGDPKGGVVRGGAYDAQAPDCRPARRFLLAPGLAKAGVGFRVVAE